MIVKKKIEYKKEIKNKQETYNNFIFLQKVVREGSKIRCSFLSFPVLSNQQIINILAQQLQCIAPMGQKKDLSIGIYSKRDNKTSMYPGHIKVNKEQKIQHAQKDLNEEVKNFH